MKKLKILFILLAVLLPFYQTFAQQLEKIPGQDSVASDDLAGFLDNLYKFGISITGILAVFMVALGAFMYIVTSAGNASKMMNAKDMITNALIGLVIALTAYLFLYVINPDLVTGTLTAPDAMLEDLDLSTTDDEEEYALSPGDDCQGTLTSGPGGGTVVNSGELSCSECEFGSDPQDTNGDGLPDNLVCDVNPASS
jgi:hypothetical protein